MIPFREMNVIKKHSYRIERFIQCLIIACFKWHFPHFKLLTMCARVIEVEGIFPFLEIE